MAMYRSIEEARQAHRDGTAEEKYHRSVGGTYIKDLVYGANDGIITTFAVVAGVAGAGLEPVVVVILGLANLVGDGISMAIGNYLGTKSERDYQSRQRAMEDWEVEHLPDEEREEVRQIYKEKGFTGEALEQVVATITADKKRWVDEMMVGELGIPRDDKDSMKPLKNGLATFIAFVIAGFLPLLPYIAGVQVSELLISSITTGLALFLVGSARCLITGRFWLKSSAEVLAVGAIAAGAAYGMGAFVGSLL